MQCIDNSIWNAESILTYIVFQFIPVLPVTTPSYVHITIINKINLGYMDIPLLKISDAKLSSCQIILPVVERRGE